MVYTTNYSFGFVIETMVAASGDERLFSAFCIGAATFVFFSFVSFCIQKILFFDEIYHRLGAIFKEIYKGIGAVSRRLLLAPSISRFSEGFVRARGLFRARLASSSMEFRASLAGDGLKFTSIFLASVYLGISTNAELHLNEMGVEPLQNDFEHAEVLQRIPLKQFVEIATVQSEPSPCSQTAREVSELSAGCRVTDIQSYQSSSRAD